MNLTIKIPKSDIEKLILLIYAAYSYLSILDTSLLNIGSVFKACQWAVLAVCFLLFIIINTKRKTNLIKMTVILAVLLFFSIAAEVTDRTYIMVYAMFIVLSDNFQFDNAVRASLISSVLALLTILFLCGIGVLTDYIYHQVGDRYAHCLGFAYYSFFPYIVFYCSTMFLYLKKGKATIWTYLIIALISILVHRFTTASLPFYLTFILLVFDFLIFRFEKLDLNKKPITVISALLYPLGAAITYFCMTSYDSGNSRWLELNSYFNGRLGLMNRGYQEYPISLFGNNIEMHGNNVLRETTNYFYIDSGFAYSILGYGVLFTVLVLFLYSTIYVYSCKTNNKSLFVWATVVLIFTMINNTWVSLNYNPILIISFTAISEMRKNRKKTMYSLEKQYSSI